MRSFSKEENGTMMLESLFCILATLIVLMLIMVLGFFAYQHAMMGIVANEVAENIVVSYKYPAMKDASSISQTNVVSLGIYRNGVYRAESDRAANENTLNEVAKTRLTKSSLAKDEGGYRVTIERELDDIGRYHFKITVKNKYSFFFEEVLKLFGFDAKESIKATTYIVGTDAIAYTNSVDTTYFVTEKVGEYLYIDNPYVTGSFSLIQTIWDFFTS